MDLGHQVTSPGKIQVEPGATWQLAIASQGGPGFGGWSTFVNFGTVTWTFQDPNDNNVIFDLPALASFNNMPGGSVTISGPQDSQVSIGDFGTFYNLPGGTLAVTGGVQAVFMAGLVSGGTIQVNGGSICEVESGGSLSGTVTVGTDSTFTVSASEPDKPVTLGDLTVNGQDATSVANLISTQGTIVVADNVTLNIDTTADATIDGADAGAILTVTGPHNLTTTFATTVTNGLTVQIDPGAGLNIQSFMLVVDEGSVIVNNGNVYWVSGLIITEAHGEEPVFINNGIFDIVGTDLMLVADEGRGFCTFENNGTLTASGGGDIYLGVIFVGDGTIQPLGATITDWLGNVYE